MYFTLDSGRSRRSGNYSEKKKYALYTIWGTSKCAAKSKTVDTGKPVIKIILIRTHAFQVNILVMLPADAVYSSPIQEIKKRDHWHLTESDLFYYFAYKAYTQKSEISFGIIL